MNCCKHCPVLLVWSAIFLQGLDFRQRLLTQAGSCVPVPSNLCCEVGMALEVLHVNPNIKLVESAQLSW